jgi:hypothetical protein
MAFEIERRNSLSYEGFMENDLPLSPVMGGIEIFAGRRCKGQVSYKSETGAAKYAVERPIDRLLESTDENP